MNSTAKTEFCAYGVSVKRMYRSGSFLKYPPQRSIKCVLNGMACMSGHFQTRNLTPILTYG